MWPVLRVSLHYICIPLTMVRVFFFNYNRKQLEKVGHNHWMTSNIWTSTISIALCISVTFLDDWMVRQLDDWLCDFVLWYTIPCSINRDAYKSSYMIQCSYSSFLYLCFSFEPHSGCQIMLPSSSLFATGGRVKLKGKTETRHIKF